MAECCSDAIFSVKVLLKKGDSLKRIVKNTIRKTSTKSSWYDLFDEVTGHIDESPDIPNSVWNDFEKHATISVSSSQNGEQYHPDPYDIIKTLHDFDKSLRYVTIEIDHPDEPASKQENTSVRSVNEVLMSSQTLTKQPSKLDPEKERFTGINLPIITNPQQVCSDRKLKSKDLELIQPQTHRERIQNRFTTIIHNTQLANSQQLFPK